MTPLSPEFKTQIAELFVDVSRLPEADKARGSALGVRLFEALGPGIEALVFDAGLRLPKIVLMPDADSAHITGERATPEIRVPLAGNFVECLQQCRSVLLQYAQSLAPNREDFFGANAAPASEKLDRPRDADANPGFGRGIGGRSLYDIANGPDKTKKRKNTRGDLWFYAPMRDSKNPAERAEWEFWRDYLFKDDVLEKMPWQDWLRSFRVLNGMSMYDVSRAIGLSRKVWSDYENSSSQSSLPGQYVIKIIKKNPFHFPDEVCIQKFTKKMGAEQIYILHRNRNLIASALKAKAISVLTGDIGSPDFFSHRDLSIIYRAFNEGNTPGSSLPYQIEDRREVLMSRLCHPHSNLSYLGFLSDRSCGGNYTTNYSKTERPKLAKALVFDLLERANSIGQFARAYRVTLGKGTAITIGKRFGGTADTVRSFFEKVKTIDELTFDQYITQNLYDFPTDETGAVHPEIVFALREINEGRRYRNPFMNAAQVAHALGIEAWQEEDAAKPGEADPSKPWVQRLEEGKSYVASAKWEAFKTYWRELEAQWKDNKKLEISGQPVKTWENPYGRMLVHEDDLDLIEKAPRWLAAKKNVAGAAQAR